MKIIIQKLSFVYLFYVLGPNNMCQVLSYDSLSKEQKLSIEANKALLSNCVLKSKYAISCDLH